MARTTASPGGLAAALLHRCDEPEILPYSIHQLYLKGPDSGQGGTDEYHNSGAKKIKSTVFNVLRKMASHAR